MTDTTVERWLTAGVGDEIVDWRHKGLAPRFAGKRVGDLVDGRLDMLASDASTPVAVLRRSALEHNAAVMRDYCATHGVDLAPHGKTTMSPELVALQLASGAWGVTAATIRQVGVLRQFGVRRILLANQLVDPAGLCWLARELAADPEFAFVCYVDSVDGVDRMTAVLDDTGVRVDVLVEVGSRGGRTGCRTLGDALAAADRVAASPSLRLRGVAAFEGILGSRTPDTVARVGWFLDHVRTVFERLLREGRFDDGDALLTAGGSAYFDLVVDRLAGGWSDRVRVVLRSGCYLTHDHGAYRRMSPLDGDRIDGGLRPAIEVWGRVLSHPEPGLAFADVGKRDVSHDSDLPVPLRARRDGTPVPVDGVTVTALNDQHAYLATPTPSPLAVGDLVGFGISHPCTTFDRWRVLPIVHDDDTLAAVAHTWF